MTNKNKKITVVVLFLVFGGLLTYNIMHPHKEKPVKEENSSQISSRNGNSSSTRLIKDSDTDEKSLQEVEWEQKYSGNQLENGAQPYSERYGKNKKTGSAQIKVNAPDDNDVIVMIKDDKGKVARHAYIRKNMSYSFHVSPGYYQFFFILGNDWCPEKDSPDGQKGFFLNYYISKDNARYYDGGGEYTLKSVINGNLNLQDADPEEVF